MTAPTMQAAVFDALGDPSRLRIVTSLCDTGPRSTLQVAHMIPLSRQAATKHLQLLAGAGILTSSKSGRERIWSVQQRPLTAASYYLAALSTRWDGAIDRLRDFVED